MFITHHSRVYKFQQNLATLEIRSVYQSNYALNEFFRINAKSQPKSLDFMIE